MKLFSREECARGGHARHRSHAVREDPGWEAKVAELSDSYHISWRAAEILLAMRGA